MKILIWAAHNKLKGHMRPAGRQFDMPIVNEWIILDQGSPTDRSDSRAAQDSELGFADRMDFLKFCVKNYLYSEK